MKLGLIVAMRNAYGAVLRETADSRDREEAERNALAQRVKGLEQVASGNHERGELLRAKYMGEPYDAVRLDVLQEQARRAFNHDEDELRARIAKLEAALREIAAHDTSQKQPCDFHCTSQIVEIARAALVKP